MPIEQEPIKIEILDEDPPVMKPEQRGANLTDNVTQTGREVADRARTAWESESRRQAQAVAEAGVRHGAQAARRGVVHGLNWLSTRLAEWADRLAKR